MLYLAIDQYRKQLTVNLRNEQGDVLLKRQMSTEWNRVHAFLAEIQGRSGPEGGFVAILEICGFNDWLLGVETGSRNGDAASIGKLGIHKLAVSPFRLPPSVQRPDSTHETPSLRARLLRCVA